MLSLSDIQATIESSSPAQSTTTNDLFLQDVDKYLAKGYLKSFSRGLCLLWQEALARNDQSTRNNIYECVTKKAPDIAEYLLAPPETLEQVPLSLREFDNTYQNAIKFYSAISSYLQQKTPDPRQGAKLAFNVMFDASFLVHRLIEKGVAPNARFSTGKTLLSAAVSYLQPDIVEHLLCKGANPNLLVEENNPIYSSLLILWKKNWGEQSVVVEKIIFLLLQRQLNLKPFNARKLLIESKINTELQDIIMPYLFAGGIELSLDDNRVAAFNKDAQIGYQPSPLMQEVATLLIGMTRPDIEPAHPLVFFSPLTQPLNLKTGYIPSFIENYLIAKPIMAPFLFGLYLNQEEFELAELVVPYIENTSVQEIADKHLKQYIPEINAQLG